LIRAAFEASDFSLLLKYGTHDLATGKASSEVCYYLGQYFYSVGDYEEASVWYTNAAFETESILNIRFGQEYPIKKLAECARKLGDMEAQDKYLNLLKQI